MFTHLIAKKVIQTALLVLIFAGVWSCSFLGNRKTGEYLPVDFDLSTNGGNFTGLGANVPIGFFNRRNKPLQTLNDLGIKYIRVKRISDNWDDLLALKAATQRLGIRWIFSLGAIPESFVGNGGQLVDIQGFANWWAEEVDELFYQEIPPDYIELLDTPDLSETDSLALTADSYNALIKATRQALDLRNYQKVKIVGPALSTPGLSGSLETWYSDLDQEAFEILDRWSVHIWENRIGSDKLYPAVAELIEYLDQIESLKPVFISSYASSETIFGQLEYPDPARYDQRGNLKSFKTYYYSASFSMPYGLKVYANTLDLLKPGGVVPLIYQLYDAPAAVKYKKQSWGLLDLNGVVKPAFTLLNNLMKRIPSGSIIIPASGEPTASLTMLIFRTRDRAVLTICNEGTVQRSITVNLHGSERSLNFTEAIRLNSPEIHSVELGTRDIVEATQFELKVHFDSENNSYSFSTSMAPQSVLIAEFQLK